MNWFKMLKRQALIIGAMALWLPAVAYGLNVMWSYATTPGEPAQPRDFGLRRHRLSSEKDTRRF